MYPETTKETLAKPAETPGFWNYAKEIFCFQIGDQNFKILYICFEWVFWVFFFLKYNKSI